MTFNLRTIFIVIIFTILLCNLSQAQPRKGEFIDVSIGYGLSFPFDDVDITSSGFYVQGEYVLGLSKWFGIRPYAGLIVTSTDKNTNIESQPEYKVTSKAFLLGGKARISAPIPWVAPYFEVGIGLSMGSFETFTPYTSIKKNGVVMHVPYTIGLALGPKHNFEVAFSYYVHPSVEQFNGAAALGFSFSLSQ